MTLNQNPSSAGRNLFLACDVGNSRVKFGLFAVPEVNSPTLPVCLRESAFSLAGTVDWTEVLNGLPDQDVRGLLAGANPAGTDRIYREWAESTRRPPFEQITDVCRQLETSVDAPDRVGVDRLLNAVAANVIRRNGQPAIIVDSGTATTVDLVDGRGVFCGGAILPGFELAAKSLHAYTALLPLVTVEQLAAAERPPLGTNTRDAISSGLFWGHVGAVRELIQLLSDRNSPIAPLVLLTGGGAKLLAEQFPAARWEPHLSLQGLILVGMDKR